MFAHNQNSFQTVIWSQELKKMKETIRNASIMYVSDNFFVHKSVRVMT